MGPITYEFIQKEVPENLRHIFNECIKFNRCQYYYCQEQATNNPSGSGAESGAGGSAEVGVAAVAGATGVGTTSIAVGIVTVIIAAAIITTSAVLLTSPHRNDDLSMCYSYV